MMRVNQDRKSSRLRRALKTRKRISESNSHRLSVYRSARHIYVQLLTSNGDKVITTISTNQKKLKKKIKKVAFDRSGYKYHGKIKALADSIRENGVKI